MRPARSAVAASTVHSAAPCMSRVRAEEDLVLPDPVLELEVGLELAPVPVPDPELLLPDAVTWPAISVDEKRGESCKQLQLRWAMNVHCSNVGRE